MGLFDLTKKIKNRLFGKRSTRKTPNIESSFDARSNNKKSPNKSYDSFGVDSTSQPTTFKIRGKSYDITNWGYISIVRFINAIVSYNKKSKWTNLTDKEIDREKRHVDDVEKMLRDALRSENKLSDDDMNELIESIKDREQNADKFMDQRKGGKKRTIKRRNKV